MKVVKRKLNQLKHYENNPRQNSQAVPKVKESIKKYGYKVPMVIDGDDCIVAGHTRHAALIEIETELGQELEYECVLADDLSEEEVAEFRIVDNLVAEQADWDITKLKSELEFLPNLDLNLFGEIPALTLEEIQIQEEEKLDVQTDGIKIKIGPDSFEITEAEYHNWVQYVIRQFNMPVIEFVKQRLMFEEEDREYDRLEI